MSLFSVIESCTPLIYGIEIKITKFRTVVKIFKNNIKNRIAVWLPAYLATYGLLHHILI